MKPHASAQMHDGIVVASMAAEPEDAPEAILAAGFGTKGRQIRLGFEGPPETQIDREELLDTPDTQQEGDAEG